MVWQNFADVILKTITDLNFNCLLFCPVIYDAFVSYAIEDWWFVEQMLESMEGDPHNLKLCIDLRDMLAGGNHNTITAEVLQNRWEVNSCPPGQNGRHVADDIFRCIFMNEKFCILIEISLKFIPKGPVDNNPSLV